MQTSHTLLSIAAALTMQETIFFGLATKEWNVPYALDEIDFKSLIACIPLKNLRIKDGILLSDPITFDYTGEFTVQYYFLARGYTVDQAKIFGYQKIKAEKHVPNSLDKPQNWTVEWPGNSNGVYIWH